MKKLIAFISSLAIVTSFSLSAFAATGTTTYVDSEISGFGEFTTKITGDDLGSQSTILAYKDEGAGLTLSGDTNIEYIDQHESYNTTESGDLEKTTTFVYKMKNKVEPGDKFVIMAGASDLNSAVTASVTDYTPITPTPTPSGEPAGYDISGTVNSALAEFTSAEYTPEKLKEINDAFATQIVLKKLASDTSAFEGKRTTVDPVTKEFKITGVTDGTYVLVIYRPGCVARFIEVNIDGKGETIVDKALIPGDTNDSSAYKIFDDITGDLVVESADFSAILLNYGKSAAGTNFNYRADTNADLVIESGDFSPILINYGKNYQAYNDGFTIPSN